MAEEAVPSFNEQIRMLKKGQSLAKAERFPVNDPPLEGINDVLARMRRTVNAAVSRVRDATDGMFRVESGVLVTNNNEAMIAVVTITRN